MIMPLSEFLRMFGRNVGSGQPGPYSSGPRNDFDELVFQNGQVTQSSRATRLVNHGKFSEVESVEMSPLLVPSRGLGLSQDEEIAPWLDDALNQDYASLLSPQVSGVSSILHSKINNNNSTNNSDNNNAMNYDPDVVSSSNCMKNETNTYNNRSNYMNFSHFARPANLVRARSSSSTEKAKVKEKGCIPPVKSTCIDNGVSSAKLDVGQSSVVKMTKEDSPGGPTENLGPKKSVDNVEQRDRSVLNAVEPVLGSSSVGSRNSADRVSCEQMHNLKRKCSDTEDSEWRSDEVDAESVGVRKPTLSQGGGSKKSRAAEVHNLSERRRRDRINEKMRALQELIPNCNKADKASMLDEAIEYLKTLQLQVQTMSMGGGVCVLPMNMMRHFVAADSYCAFCRTVYGHHHHHHHHHGLMLPNTNTETAALPISLPLLKPLHPTNEVGTAVATQIHNERGGEGPSTNPDTTFLMAMHQ